MTEEPLMYPFIVATKKYQSVFLQQTRELDLERYHYILVLIDDYKEELSQQEIADKLGIDKSFMVNIVDYLFEKGYVKRVKNIKDKRAHIIKLTEKALKAIPIIKKVVVELNERSLKNLSEEKVETFKEVLSVIQSNLSESLTFDLLINYQKVDIK